MSGTGSTGTDGEHGGGALTARRRHGGDPGEGVAGPGEGGGEHGADPAGADRADAESPGSLSGHRRPPIRRRRRRRPSGARCRTRRARRPRRRGARRARPPPCGRRRGGSRRPGPATVWMRTEARSSMRCTGPTVTATDCMRASGTNVRLRSSQPRRRSATPSTPAHPMRRHENGRSHAARRGVRENPPAPSRPVRPASTSGSTAVAASGSSSASTRCTSATVPTGSTSVRCAASLDELTDWPATLMRIDHQPNGRQRIHWSPRSRGCDPAEWSGCPSRAARARSARRRACRRSSSGATW